MLMLSIGICVGALIGLILMGLMTAASDRDREDERRLNEAQRGLKKEENNEDE